jgi:hypothetical protein
LPCFRLFTDVINSHIVFLNFQYMLIAESNRHTREYIPRLSPEAKFLVPDWGESRFWHWVKVDFGHRVALGTCTEVDSGVDYIRK